MNIEVRYITSVGYIAACESCIRKYNLASFCTESVVSGVLCDLPGCTEFETFWVDISSITSLRSKSDAIISLNPKTPREMSVWS